MTKSDSYALMRECLVQNYGGPARILNDTVMALTQRKKPAANGRSDRYSHILVILAALQRLERLLNFNPAF